MLCKDEKKIIWVTGGTKGLGLEIAKTFGKLGNTVLINYSDDDESAEQVLHIIEAEQIDIKIFKADVTKQEQLQAVVDYAMNTYGRLDLLINNAGQGLVGRTEEVGSEKFQKMINVNFVGKYNCIYAALSLLKKSDRANIINIASSSGIHPSGNMSAYCSGAAGVIMMTRCLAQDLSEWNIRVNCVSPSMLEGGMSAECFSEYDRECVRIRNPQQRLGTFEDVIKCIMWLCSGEAQYINGENIMITGGR